MMTEYFRIGKLVAAHGVNGELLLKHELGKRTSLRGLQAVFIEERTDSFLPWFVQETRIKSANEVFIRLDGVTTREAAIKLIQKEIWFTETDLKKFSAKSSPINLLGYTIIEGKKPIGKIEELIEQAHQMLCRMRIQGKEVLIPLNEDTLQRIDHRKKEVFVILPDGLLEIYLG